MCVCGGGGGQWLTADACLPTSGSNEAGLDCGLRVANPGADSRDTTTSSVEPTP